MSRVLVVGLCPLPFENTTMSFGPGIRSWQFAKGIASGGHEVWLVAMMIPGCYEQSDPVRIERVDGIRVERLSEEEFQDPEVLRRRIRELGPDAVVGATIYGSHALVRAGTNLPLWADQFGHVMAEAQAKAALDGHNEVLPYFWKMVKAVDLRADKLSSVSERQRLALIGELGALGRLTATNCGHEFVSVVPCAVIPQTDLPNDASRGLLGSSVPEDAFIVLWSGSYNVWSDARTLFKGVEAAMKMESRVHFVSTGGAIPGHDNRTYSEFQDLVKSSPLAGRFHLRGWVPGHEVPKYWSAADLGVLVEHPIYEGELGSKNRVIQWLGAGLPVLYNRVGDLGDLLHGQGLGLTFEVGRADQLAGHITWACRHPAELRSLADRARTYAREQLSLERTTESLRTWTAAPSSAERLREGSGGGGDPSTHEGAVQAFRSRLAALPVVRRSRWLRRIWRRFSRRA